MVNVILTIMIKMITKPGKALLDFTAIVIFILSAIALISIY